MGYSVGVLRSAIFDQVMHLDNEGLGDFVTVEMRLISGIKKPGVEV